MSVIVAGHLVVEPSDRDAHVAASSPVVEAARATDGCLAFVVAADLHDPSRVVLFEHWRDRAALTAFRGDGPNEEMASRVVAFEVEEYDVTPHRPEPATSGDEPTTVPPASTPPIVGRDEYEQRLAEQVEVEKELTRFGDRVAARRRRLPMTPIDDYVLTGDDGPVRLSALFGDHPQLVLQTFMFHPDWEDGCPSCTWAADNMPRDLERLLAPKGIAFAMVSRAPLDRLRRWSERRGWDHLTWVSAAGTDFHADWGWTVDGQDQPGYSYLLRTDDGVFLTYRTRRRGTEAILPVPAIWDRTVYGRQQTFEDSPDGWPQEPTYG